VLSWDPTKTITKEKHNRSIVKRQEVRNEKVADSIINRKALRIEANIKRERRKS
jgi:hypothetical protein